MAEAYRRLTQEEHARLRPDAYVGSVSKEKVNAFVYSWTRNVVQRVSLDVSPALLKVFDEVLQNAADNKVRDPRGQTYIKVWLRPTGFVIENDGAALPIEMHPEYQVLIPSLVFGELLTGSNFNDAEERETAGRNGMGAKLTNLFSTRFTVTTADSIRKRTFSQTWTHGMQNAGTSLVTAVRSTPSFTRIEAELDLARLGHGDEAELSENVLALLARRVTDLAAFFGPTLRVFINDTALEVNSLTSYAKLFQIAEEPTVSWRAVDGRTELLLFSVPHGGFVFSLVNGVYTSEGGTHVQQVTDALHERVTHILKRTLGRGSDEAVENFAKPAHIREHTVLFLSCRVVNPSFTSQSKTRLATRTPLKLPSTLFTDRVTEQSPFVLSLSESLRARSIRAARAATGSTAERRSAILNIEKLDDANWAGSSRSSECSLILTEGDSAKALAVAGLSVVGRDKFGVFPLKGKPLNVHGVSETNAVKNAEIADLIRILGLSFGTRYETTRELRTLRYGSVIIMTDQDADGSHICGLLLNQFETFWPSLLRHRGFVKRFVTPLVKIKRGNSILHEFFNLQEFNTFTSANPRVLATSGTLVKYYKGLGTSSAEEARAYFRNTARHLHPFEAATEEDERRLRRSFQSGASAAEERRQWISQFCAPAPSTSSTFTISDFVERDLIVFSVADNVRSIPHFLDGLKPSQRKVLAALFKRGASASSSEIKVAQLAGYVSEHMAYHHGEASLTATIVGMAQDFVGSNNVPLLVPEGQFGTRLKGGDDAASPRYIFTRLHPVARLLFPSADDALLEREKEGDDEVEPKYYIPVIPFLLVNGASGIGTGWSTSVPSHDPRAVLQATRALVRARSAEAELAPLTPSWRGFVGACEARGTTGWRTFGVVSRVSNREVEITELPMGKWTEVYKSWLGSASAEPRKRAASSPEEKPPLVARFSDNSSDTQVRIRVTLNQDAPTDQAELMELLKLTSDVSVTNMHALHDAAILKFSDAREVVRSHFRHRLALYEARLRLLLEQEERRLLFLSERARFMMAVLQGDLVLMRRKRSELELELQREGYLHGRDHLALPLLTLTEERVQEVLKERDDARLALEFLRASSAFDLWERDLDALECGV